MDQAHVQTPCLRYDDQQTIVCLGNWSFLRLTRALETQVQTCSFAQVTVINAQSITTLDSAGAELLLALANLYPQASLLLSPEAERLVTLIKKYPRDPAQKVTNKKNWLEHLGMQGVQVYLEAIAYLKFIGAVSYCFWQSLKTPWRLPWCNIAKTIETSGFYGLFIIGLLSFLVGIVLAYQMGGQLKNYGANIFVVNLLGISILREFAPLMTAIIVAGRTGSSFAAELGTMKVNQELDALTTMGVSPIRFLVLPKMLGLIIALPLLSMWAAFTGLLGGIIMSKIMLGITLNLFIDQLHTAVSIKQLLLGLMKTPVFAAIIASVGCFQGLQVQGGAESVGRQTTRSVVQSLFLIIVADAFFSILLSLLHA